MPAFAPAPIAPPASTAAAVPFQAMSSQPKMADTSLFGGLSGFPAASAQQAVRPAASNAKADPFADLVSLDPKALSGLGKKREPTAPSLNSMATPSAFGAPPTSSQGASTGPDLLF
ncbi:hypothetical protein HK405_015537 [Cladochytrium tenue]|nr:hypothetical protein HK405_015537 [Cladochytrium tenue]